MSNNRRSSWVDYGNLAANLFQIAQISSAQQRLNQLTQLETQREQRREWINELRQIIFGAENGLEKVKKYITQAPRGAPHTTMIASPMCLSMYPLYSLITASNFAHTSRTRSLIISKSC